MINLLHTIRKTKKILFALVSLLTLTLILITSLPSHGLIPDAAYIIKFQGTRLTLGAGNSRNRQPVQLQDRLESNRILYVPGDNQHWANLAFITNSPLDSTGLMVTAGPHRSATQWSFPCTARGHFTIGWQRGGDRGCEPGIPLQPSSSVTSQLSAGKVLTAQSRNGVILVPTPNQSLLQTFDSPTGVLVDVLIGEVNVQSDRYPQGRLIRAGERYAYPEDTVTPIDANAILNSPELQDFLNSNNWFSPDMPERMASAVLNQVSDYQIALGQSPTNRVGQCNQQQASGSSGITRTTFNLNRTSGIIRIRYDMVDVPDLLEVLYQGQVIWSTAQVPGNNSGYVSGTNEVSIPFQGSSNEIIVQVTGNPSQQTQWSHTVYCPS